MQHITYGDMPWAPNFSVSVEGSDITDRIRESLVGIKITDYGAAEKKSDQVTIAILSETLDLPKKGAKLSVAIGFGTELVDRGTYVVDALSSTAASGARTIGITGRAFSKSNAYGHSTVQSQRLRSFDNITLGDLVSTIAAEHGLTPRVPASLANTVISHVDQINESDMNLMTRLAAGFGAVSKISHDYWMLVPRDGDTNFSGNPLPKMTILRDMTTSWSYHNNSDHPDTTTPGNGTQIYSYVDSATGGIKHFTVGSGEPVEYLGGPAGYPSLAVAQSVAYAGSVAKVKKLKGMTITMPATPEMLTLTAQCLITTSGFGTVEDADWKIGQLDIAFSKAGATITMELE